MKLRVLLGLVFGAVSILGFGVVSAGASVDLPWQTGMRAVGNGATVEPAVDLTTGTQTFLITPNHSPFYDASQNPGAPIPPPFKSHSAPLYLVTYPLASTADALDPFNCYTEGFFAPGLPYNCDHAQIPGIKGHDHLVGVPGSKRAGGDFDVAWHVLATFFTPQGMNDGAMNHRILTWDQLKAAQAAGDVSGFADTGIYFECADVSSAVYRGGTPLTFAPGQP